MMQCTGAVAIRESVRDFSNELLRLETDPCRLERVKTLANQIRNLILHASVNREPLLDEARCCAEMLNRLSRLKRR